MILHHTFSEGLIVWKFWICGAAYMNTHKAAQYGNSEVTESFAQISNGRAHKEARLAWDILYQISYLL
jgi:hypothetical protein